MRRSLIGIIGFIVGILLLAAGSVILLQQDGRVKWNSAYKSVVRAENGHTDKDTAESTFTISKAGKYILNLQWTPEGKKAESVTEGDVGFVTVCRVTDQRGALLYAVYGTAFDASATLDMTEGNYHLEYSFYTDKEELEEFLKCIPVAAVAYDAEASGYDLEKLAKNGEWKMDAALNVSSLRAFSVKEMCAAFCVLAGSCILLMIVVALLRNSHIARSRYDERQELEQGRAFRFSFFAVLITIGITCLLDTTGVVNGGMTTVFYSSAVFAGLIVYVVYCFWHDCYIALNENKAGTLVVLFVISAVNLALGISSVAARGWMGADGKLFPASLNVLLGAAAMIIFAAGLIRAVTERTEGQDDGRDDE